MSININTYYQVLDVDETAGLIELKRAYRKKALLLHPDKNSSPNAHNDFVLLTEAYDYLSKLKSAGNEPVDFENWQTTGRYESREKAATYADMPHTDYKSTDHYKESNPWSVFLSHCAFFLSIAYILAAPLVGYIIGGGPGIFITSFLLLSGAPIFSKVLFTNRPKLNFPLFVQSAAVVIKTPLFLSITLTVGNIIILFAVTFHTLLANWITALAFFLAGVLAALLSALSVSGFKNMPWRFNVFCAAPALVNLFFLLNFTFSSAPSKESYSFRHQMAWYSFRGGGGSYQSTTQIHLEGGKYEEFGGIRIFWDYDSMKNADTITYTFETGLFGLRVMKHAQFN